MAHLLHAIAAENRKGRQAGLYSVCSANELVLRGAIRHAASHQYPLIIESTSNQVNQFGGYTGIRPAEFRELVHKIAGEEGMSPANLVLGGDHLGPLLWQHESETAALYNPFPVLFLKDIPPITRGRKNWRKWCGTAQRFSR